MAGLSWPQAREIDQDLMAASYFSKRVSQQRFMKQLPLRSAGIGP